jgi:hypothetical protein
MTICATTRESAEGQHVMANEEGMAEETPLGRRTTKVIRGDSQAGSTRTWRYSKVLVLRRPLPEAKGLEGRSLTAASALALRDAALRAARQG